MQLTHGQRMTRQAPLGARQGHGQHRLDAGRATREDTDPVCQPQRLLEIVRDPDRGGAGTRPNGRQLLDQQLARLRVQGRERLVEKQDGRTHGKRPGDADPLTHAARELPRVGVAKVGKADGAQRLLDPLAAQGRGQPALERQGDVFLGRPPGQQGKVLEDVGERVEAAIGNRADRTDRAGGRLEQAAQHAQEGRLAATRGPQQGQRLAGLDHEVDVGQDLEIVITMGDAGGLEAHAGRGRGRRHLGRS